LSVQQAAVSDDIDRLRLVRGVGGGIAETRGRSWIEGNSGSAARGDREWRHVSPMRADCPLNATRQHDTVLADQIFDLKRLPPVWIDELDLGQGHHQRRIDRL